MKVGAYPRQFKNTVENTLFSLLLLCVAGFIVCENIRNSSPFASIFYANVDAIEMFCYQFCTY